MKGQHAFALFFLVFMIGTLLLSRWGMQGKAVTPQLSAATLAEVPADSAFDRLMDTTFQHFLEEQGLMGLSVGIMRDNRLVYAKGFGWADTTNHEPVQVWHQFRMGSVSKWITALAVMQLVAEQKLDLDSCLFCPQGLLARFATYPDPKYQQMTPRHLLTHTGGWGRRYYWDPLFMGREIAEKMSVPAPAQFSTMFSFALGFPLSYPPGQVFDYSNFGYCVLGLVIEQASGMRYEDYVRNCLLRPVGLFDMRLGGTEPWERAPAEVSYYDLRSRGLHYSLFRLGKLFPKPYADVDIRTLGPAGGWVASPRDLLWLLAHADAHPVRPDRLPLAQVLEMASRHGKKEVPLGWSYVDGDFWWRTGKLAGTSAILVRRDARTAWCVITNTTNSQSDYFNQKVAQNIDQAFEKITEWPNRDRFVYP